MEAQPSLENMDSFNDLVIQTQMSQKNYIMSKAGDTIEDYPEDGVTPTPRAEKRKEEADGDADLAEFRMVLELSDLTNR